MKVNYIVVWGKESLVYNGPIRKRTQEWIKQVKFVEGRIHFINRKYNINQNS